MSERSPSPTDTTKPLLRALAGRPVQPPPVWLMRQAGRYLPEYREVRSRVSGFLELCYTPELAVEVTLQPIRRYGFDAAILFSDILVVPDALGQPVRFVEGEGPRLEPVRSAEEVARLEPDRLHEHLAPVYETVRRLRRELPPEVALIGFAGAPWTVATYMVEGGSSRDFARVRGWGVAEPVGFGALIRLVTEATIEYLVKQVEAGAEALQLFDSWAGVLSEDEFGRWAIEPMRQIVDAVKARCPGVPIIGFPRGAGVMYARYVEEAGIDAVSLDSSVPLRWAAETLQPRVTVQGNLDPLLLLSGGEPMKRGARRILEELGGGPMVFNLGHGVIKETPPEHVAELLEIVRGSGG
ncbi:MAG TPA: uroporphyrinogen decarboxylase [Alphaproteobacteria bacterium]|nr:uroporphyrinogen decarboxylase [Alphaproteobacteria bacterium]